MGLRISCVFRFLPLLFSVGFSAQAAPIFLPEDEFTLQPLLNRVETQQGSPEEGFNVISVDKKKRRALKGEWLRFGDQIDLPARTAIEVIERENFKWIGGGVLQGSLGTSPMTKDDLVYELVLDRGWVKVWIKADSDQTKVQVHTLHGIFEASQAEFWISTRPAQTEIYLVSGEIRRLGNGLPLINRSYAVFEGTDATPRYIAKSWDAVAVEVKISGAYPALGRLSTQAESDWDTGRSSRTYADYRKKGWRKADPLEK